MVRNPIRWRFWIWRKQGQMRWEAPYSYCISCVLWLLSPHYVDGYLQKPRGLHLGFPGNDNYPPSQGSGPLNSYFLRRRDLLSWLQNLSDQDVSFPMFPMAGSRSFMPLTRNEPLVSEQFHDMYKLWGFKSRYISDIISNKGLKVILE